MMMMNFVSNEAEKRKTLKQTHAPPNNEKSVTGDFQNCLVSGTKPHAFVTTFNK